MTQPHCQHFIVIVNKAMFGLFLEVTTYLIQFIWILVVLVSDIFFPII